MTTRPKGKAGKAVSAAATTVPDAVTTAGKQQDRVIGKPFKAGSEWNGNAKGRPRSSRHKLGEDFVQCLAKKFTEKGEAAIDEVIRDKPAEFLRVIAAVLPKQLEAEDDDGNVYGVALITSNAIEAIIERGRK